MRGRIVPLDEVTNRIREFNRASLIEMLCFIMSALHTEKLSDLEKEKILGNQFFKKEWIEVFKARAEKGEPQRLFDQLIVVQLMKLTLVYAQKENKGLFFGKNKVAHYKLGELLLMCGDHFNSSIVKWKKLTPQEEEQEFGKLILKEILYSRKPGTKFDFVRYWDLLVSIPEKEKLSETTESLFQEATGIKLEIYVLVIFGILIVTWNFDPKKQKQPNPYINFDSFVENLGISKEQIEKIKARIAGSPDALEALVSEEVKARKYHYNPELLWKKPIVTIANKFMCLDQAHLSKHFYQHIFWIIADYLSEYDRKNGTARRKEFTRSLGEAFESYVKRIIKRAYKNRKEVRLFFDDGKFHYKANGKRHRMPDALIISTQNKILLIEVKTIKIPPNIYTCENLKEFEAFLWDEEKSDFRKAVKTLETKVEHIINGNLDNDLKINSSRIKKIYPVLINLEEIPQSPYITKEKIWEEFENQNRVWREKQVARLQIVSSEELELLEDVLQLYKWEDLIDRRLSEPDKSIQELDFECFLRMLKEKYQFNIRMDSRYITKRWHQIFGRIIKEEIKRLEERVDPAPA